jgi:putative zinc finger/helix-turn-helix YgiT family protein
MAKPAESLGVCPVCRKGHLVAAERVRVFEPHGKRVEVKLLTSLCDTCGETTTKAAQHQENLRALAERKGHYGTLLMGEEILALRKRYGLTQQQASAIFGKGKIAFSRYESETTYPDESTTLLLTLAIERPDVMKVLADKASVELPLWPERCEDGQRVKLRPIRVVPAPATHREKVQFTVPVSGSVLARHHGAAVIRKVSKTWTNPACNDSQALEAVAS